MVKLVLPCLVVLGYLLAGEASAIWRVRTLDKESREERTFVLTEDSLSLPTMDGWLCMVAPEIGQIRKMTCGIGEARVGMVAARGLDYASMSLWVRSSPREWGVFLEWVK